MPTRIERIRATLHDLETELTSLSGPELDGETRAMLERTIGELQSALATQPPAIEPHSLAERLMESAESLRVSHPTLFEIVNRAADALSRIGI